jgi:hypothetical protein
VRLLGVVAGCSGGREISSFTRTARYIAVLTINVVKKADVFGS